MHKPHNTTEPGGDDTPILAMEKLCKSYWPGATELKVLRDIDLSIGRGEYLAIMGPSGSGKSTLLNMIGCLDQPSNGRYLLGGDNVSTLDDDQLSRFAMKGVQKKTKVETENTEAHREGNLVNQ